MNTKQNVGVGVVGAGKVGAHEHIPGAQKAGGEVLAVCDIDLQAAENAARRYQVARAVDSMQELLEMPGLDLVAICTGVHHKDLAIQALEAGKHVYLEKPPTRTRQEMMEVKAVADRCGKYVYAGSHHLYRENIRYVHDAIARGEFGELYAIDCLKLRRGYAPGDHAGVRERGGVTSGSAVHRLDVALFLLGMPEVDYVTAVTSNHFVKAEAARQGREISGLVDDTVIATIRFTNGCMLTLRDLAACHMIEDPTEFRWFGDFTIFGNKAGCSLHPLTVYQEQADGELRTTQPKVNNDVSAGHEPVYRYLIDCIRRGEAPEQSPARAVRLMELLEAMYLSASSNGAQVRLDEIRKQ